VSSKNEGGDIMSETKRRSQPDPTLYKGILNAFDGAYPRDQGFLIVDGKPIPCDIPRTGQTLIKFIGSTSTESLIGKEILYSLDDQGFLAGFAPRGGTGCAR
jgi:hypothetical protein